MHAASSSRSASPEKSTSAAAKAVEETGGKGTAGISSGSTASGGGSSRAGDKDHLRDRDHRESTPQHEPGSKNSTGGSNQISPDITTGKSVGGSSGKNCSSKKFEPNNSSSSSSKNSGGENLPKSKSHFKSSSSTASSSSGGISSDSLTVKLERLENSSKNSSSNPSTHSKNYPHPPKKDFSTIQLKEVVTAALDRPMVNPPNSKYSSPDPLSSLDTPSTRHSKLQPPDIKPDVTLTPIPMSSATSSKSNSSRHSKDNDDLSEPPGVKTPAGQFHLSGLPKLQNQQVSPDMSEPPGSKNHKPPELSIQEELPILDKASTSGGSGPPSKRARGISREGEREDSHSIRSRTPTKGGGEGTSRGRGGGRRGSSAASVSSERGSTSYRAPTTRAGGGGDISSAVAFVDDSSFDEIIEATTAAASSAASSRSAKKSGGAATPATCTAPPPKPSPAAPSPATRKEDPPAPTLSQLVKSGQLSAGGGSLCGADDPQGNTPPPGLAPHMFGNALNPSSSMALKMVDTLSEEMEAVVQAGGSKEVVPPQPIPLVGIPLPGPPTGKRTTSSTSLEELEGNGPHQPPQTLEQLLERQWEQGSQFLMEQAQHLDIAQLLSCLNQLKQDNRALEEHVNSLIQRKEQLTAINARLSIPLGSGAALTAALGGALGGREQGRGSPPVLMGGGALQKITPLNSPPGEGYQGMGQVQQQRRGDPRGELGQGQGQGQQGYLGRGEAGQYNDKGRGGGGPPGAGGPGDHHRDR